MANLACLLIEDSQTQAKFISQMIASAGWTVYTALNLKHALLTLKTETINLVISDLFLPDCDDGSTIAKLKAIHPDLTYAAMTAGSVKADAGKVLFRAKADGAEFLLQKPFSKDKLQETLDEVKDRIECGVRKPHVMIVEDSSTVRIICKKMLEANGYRTSGFASMDEAIEALSAIDLDIILTDLNMEGTQPKEIIPLLRENMPGVAIIAMTGSQEEDLNKTLDLGADTAVTKPFSEPQLISAIRNAQVLANAALLKILNAQQQVA